jgi:AICAR transformylase/IMP cyclohydrolase PurH
MLTSELGNKDRMSSFGDIVALSDEVDVWVILSALFFPYERGKF